MANGRSSANGSLLGSIKHVAVVIFVFLIYFISAAFVDHKIALMATSFACALPFNSYTHLSSFESRQQQRHEMRLNVCVRFGKVEHRLF